MCPSVHRLTGGHSQGGRRAVTVALALLLLTGCASAPAAPVESITPLVGKWAGTVETEKGSQQFFYLTVNPDQTIVATWGIYWSWGRIALADGQATYRLNPPPLEGTVRFYQGNGTATLYLDDLWATFHAVVTKQQ